jgi:hypothetical protein
MTIVGDGSELRPPTHFWLKNKGPPPTLSEIILLSKKKQTNLPKIAENELNLRKIDKMHVKGSITLRVFDVRFYVRCPTNGLSDMKTPFKTHRVIDP